MSQLAETLGVSHSNLRDQLSRPDRPRGAYVKAGDDALLAEIRSFVDQRLTYDYRRITALVNRARAAERLDKVNHKQVYQLMKRHGLLLQAHSGRREGRVHGGKVMVMCSNLRWCSDAQEFTCWNGDMVRVAFIIDAHDREITAWFAAQASAVPTLGT